MFAQLAGEALVGVSGSWASLISRARCVYLPIRFGFREKKIVHDLGRLELRWLCHLSTFSVFFVWKVKWTFENDC